MPDEALITEIENVLSEVVRLGGENERSQIVPNLTVQDANPAGLTGFVIVSDDRDGDNILAKKVPSVAYADNNLVNVLFPRGGEAVAFQQGSQSVSGDLWEIVPSTSTDIFYDKGNVGVGTATPADEFHVLDGTADIVMGAGAAGFGGISFDTSLTIDNYSLLGQGTDTFLNRSTGGTLYFREGNSTQMIILPTTGNVGIGTVTVPHGGVGAAKLAVEGVNASVGSGPHVQISTALDDFPLVQLFAYGHDDIWLQFDAYSDTSVGNSKSSDLGSNFAIAKTTNQLVFTYDSLVAAGNAITWNDGIILDRDGNVIVNEGGISTADFRVEGDTQTHLLFTDANVDRVGINTSGPDAQLDVLNASSAQLRLTHTDGSKFADFTLDTNHDLTIKPSSTGQIKLQPTTDSTDFFQVLDADGGTPVLNVDSTNERVGVGTAAPAATFHAVSASEPIRSETSGFNTNTLFLLSTFGGLTNVVNSYYLQNATPADTLFGQLAIDNITRTAGSETGTFKFSVVDAGAFATRMAIWGSNIGFGTTSPGSLTEWNFTTEDLEFVDAGSAAATEQDWIEVQVGGSTGYIRVFASK